jgi:hypothetical protein
MQLENFSKLFWVQKKGIWAGTNTQRKLLLNFFRFFGDFVPVLKAKKVVLFGISAGTKSEILNF